MQVEQRRIKVLHVDDGNVTGIIGFELDITKRIQAQEELRNAHKELHDIIEFLPDATFVINRDKKVIAWNRAMEEMTGIRKEDIMGKGDYAYAVPFYGIKRAILIDLIFLSDKEIESRYDYIRREGNTLFAETFIPSMYGGKGAYLWGAATPLIDSEGNVVGAIESIRDITERKRAEEELWKGESRYRLLAENVTDVIWTIDMNLRFTYMSPSIMCLTGYSVEEAMGMTLEESMSPASYELAMKTLAEELAMKKTEQKDLGRSRTLELELTCKDGSTVWVEAKMTFLRDPDGQPVGIIGVSRDITERKRAEDALQKSEEEYRSLVESTEDSVYLVDRDCRYLFVNEKHLSRIGLPKDQVIGKTYGELHSEDETEEFAEIVEDVFETGKSVQHEHRSRRDNRYFIRTLSPVNVKDSEGITTAVTVVSKDITNLKLAEKERERLLKELEAKNREMEHFTYTVSHDLSSPLMTIRGFATIIREDLEQGKTEDMESYLERIESAATKMDHLLNDTLELSRIGRVANPPEDVPFGEIVKDALEQTAEQIKSSGVEVAVAEDFPTVHVDRMRIEEALVNLITNSIRYRGEQPSPKIDLGYRVDGESKETVFFVKDNGIGLEKSQHEKVFELFYLLDRCGGEGTGAGLAIVKRIIEVHNGRIWIESEKGKGCTVCFTLPAQ